jgi:hypothetical protein
MLIDGRDYAFGDYESLQGSEDTRVKLFFE